jgi:hypothetical protein
MRDAAKPAIPWVMIETLAPDTMSVATVGGEARGFAGPLRVVQRLLARNPALYDGITTARLIDRLGEVRDQGKHIYQEIQTAAGPHKLVARAVPGPAAAVHAVQFWIGPAAAVIPPPRRAIGATWDIESQIVRQPLAMAQLFGPMSDDIPAAYSLAELFHRATMFDRHGELISLLYDPKPGGRLQFDIALRHRANMTRRWRVAVRGGSGVARWLWEDVSAETPALTHRALEHIALREAHRRTGTCLAVVHLAGASICDWLTDPAEWIKWDGLTSAVEVFHPEDRRRLRALAEGMTGGAGIDITVGTLDRDSGYRPTRMLIYPYPDQANPHLAVVEFVRPEPARGSPINHRSSRASQDVLTNTSVGKAM